MKCLRISLKNSKVQNHKPQGINENGISEGNLSTIKVVDTLPEL